MNQQNGADGFSLKQMNQEQTMLQKMLIVIVCKFAPDTRKITITEAECAQLAKDFGAPEKNAALLQSIEKVVLTLEVVSESEALLRMVDQAAASKQAAQTEPLIAVVRH